MRYADVILPVPLQGTFTYAVPEGMGVGVGCRVLVSFGRSKMYLGIVLRLHDQKPEGYEVKPIAQRMDEEPIVTDHQLKLWQWIADYYLSPIGDVYKAALPAGLKAEDGYRPKTETYIRLTEAYRNVTALHIALNVLARAKKQLEAFTDYLALSHWDEIEDGDDASRSQVVEVTREELMNVSGASADTLKILEKRKMLETYEVEVGRLNHGGAYRPELIQPLSAVQQTAYNEILFSMLKKNVTLLHGVTGSGKTEIYIHLIKLALERKEQVLYLLPEIALTVQMMERLQRVFGDKLGIYHSKYSDAERVEIWQKQLSQNPYEVILGARSAVFLPFQRLGMVIVDEEHENSYKQQDPAPRYHARSAAIASSFWRSLQKLSNILETFFYCIAAFPHLQAKKQKLLIKLLSVNTLNGGKTERDSLSRQGEGFKHRDDREVSPEVLRTLLATRQLRQTFRVLGADHRRLANQL